MLRNEMKRKATDLNNLSAAKSPTNPSSSSTVNNHNNNSTDETTTRTSNSNDGGGNGSGTFNGGENNSMGQLVNNHNGNSLIQEQFRRFQQQAAAIQIINSNGYGFPPAFNFQPITPITPHTNNGNSFTLPLLQNPSLMDHQKVENANRTSGTFIILCD